jgi:hypothetical protein
MTIGLTGIAALEAEMRDRLADKDAEIARLRERLNVLWIAFQDDDAFRRVFSVSSDNEKSEA